MNTRTYRTLSVGVYYVLSVMLLALGAYSSALGANNKEGNILFLDDFSEKNLLENWQSITFQYGIEDGWGVQEGQCISKPYKVLNFLINKTPLPEKYEVSVDIKILDDPFGKKHIGLVLWVNKNNLLRIAYFGNKWEVALRENGRWASAPTISNQANLKIEAYADGKFVVQRDTKSGDMKITTPQGAQISVKLKPFSEQKIGLFTYGCSAAFDNFSIKKIQSLWEEGKLTDPLDERKNPTSILHLAEHIRYPEATIRSDHPYYFRKVFTVDKLLKSAKLKITAGHQYTLYLNGQEIGRDNEWSKPEIYNVDQWLHPGQNLIAVEMIPKEGYGSLLVDLTIEMTESKKRIISDETWRALDKNIKGWSSLTFNDHDWPNADSLGSVAMTPWLAVAGERFAPFFEGYSVQDALSRLECLQGERQKPYKTEVKLFNGVPTLFINDIPTNFMIKFPFPGKQERTAFASSGIHNYFIYINLNFWSGPGQCDFTYFDWAIWNILKSDPRAHIVLRFNLQAPKWWIESHPDELIRYLDMPAKSSLNRNQFASPASERWKEDTAEVIRKFAQHIKNSVYASRIIGIDLAYGMTNEWGFYGYNYLPDISQPMQQAFREWVRQEYNNDIQALRKSWLDPQLDFDKVKIPEKKERLISELSFFKDPVKEKKTIDYYRFHTRIWAQNMPYFAKILRQTTEGKIIIGAFGAYAYPYNSQDRGYLDKNLWYSNSDITFIGSTKSNERKMAMDIAGHKLGIGACKPGSDGRPLALIDSLRLHNKILLYEEDVPSHVYTDKKSGFFPMALHNLSDTIQYHRSRFAYCLIKGAALEWTDHGMGWFNDLPIFEEWGRMRGFLRDALRFDRSSRSEIAAFVNDRSNFYTAHWMTKKDTITHSLLAEQWRPLFRMGAPVDFYTQEDILDPDLPDYKVYFLINPFYMDSQERKAIRNKLGKDGNTIIWIYAPGFIDKKGMSEEAMYELTGIRIKSIFEPSQMIIQTINTTDPITKGLSSQYRFGNGKSIEPTFYVDDPQAISLGVIEDNGRVGFAVKRFSDWTSIYVFCPVITAPILRNIAAESGVHSYIDTEDVLYVNQSYLAVVTNEKSGKRTIALPESRHVYDLFNQQIVAQNAEQFDIKMDPYTTYLFMMLARPSKGDFSK